MELLAGVAIEERKVAHTLSGEEAADPRAFEDLGIPPHSKKVFALALGMAFTEHRDRFFEIARRLDFDPSFPHRLLAKMVEAPASAR